MNNFSRQALKKEPKNLLDLINFFNLNISQFTSFKNHPVLGLTMDSREVQPGFVFVALKGEKLDGVLFIPEAIQQGAVAILIEEGVLPKEGLSDLSVLSLQIKNLKNYLPDLGLFFAGLENLKNSELPILAVTGTNGKTTISTLLAQFLSQWPCGVMGSLGAGFLGNLKDTHINTPDPLKTACLFKKLIDEGARVICLEASSHGLDQDRLRAIPITTAIFTNLTQDHLDYHDNLENYAQAKAKLFSFESLKQIILNNDDPWSDVMHKAAHPGVPVLTYGLNFLNKLNKKSDIWISHSRLLTMGYELKIETPMGSFETQLNLMGEFNLSNYLAVVSALVGMGVSLESIKNKTPGLIPPKGRMEIFQKINHPTVVIDYAHTPDAMEKVLKTLRGHTRGKLWVLFGCGGDRDRTKRPLMARIAEKLADRVIVTGDNSRSEDPAQIQADIKAGFAFQNYELIPDRAEAIQWACQTAAPEDLILLAGKGHETYLEINNIRHDFDERDYIFSF